MNLKKGLIILAIAVIYALFIGYGIEVFHDSPKQEQICPNVYDLQDREECLAAGGIWRAQYCKEGVVNDIAAAKEQGVQAAKAVPVENFGVCETKSTCWENFSLMMSKHDKVVFIVAAIFGILAIVAGIILKKEGVNDGFVAGGILLILYGTIRYWQHANDILKFSLLGLVLAVLIWIGYKKLDHKNEKK